MEDEEARLIELARAGDADAFDRLAGLHRAGVVRLVTSLIGDRDEAEAIAQESATRALQQMPAFREGAPFGPWIRGIALNLGRKHLRDRARHARPVAPEHLAEAEAPEGRRRGVLSGILRREAGEAALRAIDELPLALREAFVQHYIEGLDYAEIGRMTGLAPGTLRVRAHRARTLLRHSLGPVVETWLLEGRPHRGLTSSLVERSHPESPRLWRFQGPRRPRSLSHAIRYHSWSAARIKNRSSTESHSTPASREMRGPA